VEITRIAICRDGWLGSAELTPVHLSDNLANATLDPLSVSTTPLPLSK